MKADRRRAVNVIFKSVLIGVLITLLPSLGLALPPLHVTAPRNFVTGPIPSQVLPMDLDGDGNQDVVVKCSDVLNGPQLQLFENPGNGTLVFHSSIPLPADTELVPADLNGDGRLDLVQVHTVATINGELLTLVQNGLFSFATKTLALPFPCSHLCIGDLDGINGPDLVIGDDLASPLVHVYLANGTGGSFQSRGWHSWTFQYSDGSRWGTTRRGRHGWRWGS